MRYREIWWLVEEGSNNCVFSCKATEITCVVNKSNACVCSVRCLVCKVTALSIKLSASYTTISNLKL
jgi:hypothetical protein